MRPRLPIACLIALLLGVPGVVGAEESAVRLEPDGNRFGTVRADGARVSPSRWWNPYGPNVLKGDVPFAGRRHFVVTTVILDSIYTDARGDRDADPVQVSNSTALFSLEYFVGQTVFRPKTFALRATGLARTVIDARGEADRVEDFSLGETFMEVLLADHGVSSYDSTSLRAGVQAFNADVLGLVLNDALPAGRLFSEWRHNRWNATILYGRPLEKDLESALPLEDRALQADVVAANLSVGDAFFPGFNLTLLGAYDDDRRIEGERSRIAWSGLAASGHLGRFVTAPAIYFAAGSSGIDGDRKNVLAPLAVVDIARPSDLWNPRLTFLWAPGDHDPADDDATAYDAFADKVAFAGGAGAGVFAGKGLAPIFRKGSVLPSLRGGNAPPNFVHGGIQLLDLGVDLQVSPRFTFSADGVAFAWDDPKTLGLLLGLAETPDAFAATEAIGQLKLRPFLNEQALIALSAAALVPATGLSDVTGSSATEVKADVRVILAF